MPRHTLRASLALTAPWATPVRALPSAFSSRSFSSLQFALCPPHNAADAKRAAVRSPLGLLSDRLVLDSTFSNRGTLTAAFSQWLVEVTGFSLEELLGTKPFEAEKAVECLVMSLRLQTSAKPSLRRQVQGAWGLAFAWQSEEPYNHHTAMPAIVFFALLSTCLLWGWTAEAGIFALARGGLLRISEATQAKRCDFVLLEDTLRTQDFVLLRVNQPKTRLRGARHQAAKVEQRDLVQTISPRFFWPVKSCAPLGRF